MQAKKKIFPLVIFLVLCGLLLCVCAILAKPTQYELMCQKVNYIVDHDLLQHSEFENAESDGIYTVKTTYAGMDVFLWGTNKKNICATVEGQFDEFELIISFYNDRIRINVEGDSYRNTEYSYGYWCDVDNNLEPLGLDDADFWARITYECIAEDELRHLVRNCEAFLTQIIEEYFQSSISCH